MERWSLSAARSLLSMSSRALMVTRRVMMITPPRGAPRDENSLHYPTDFLFRVPLPDNYLVYPVEAAFAFRMDFFIRNLLHINLIRRRIYSCKLDFFGWIWRQLGFQLLVLLLAYQLCVLPLFQAVLSVFGYLIEVLLDHLCNVSSYAFYGCFIVANIFWFGHLPLQ